MRLGHTATPRSSIPVIALANVAFLVWTSVVISGMYSASRGPSLRFASADRDGSFDDSDAVRVAVLSDSEATIDGEPVTLHELAAGAKRHLAGRASGSILLTVSPDASYEAMVAAYAALSSLPGRPRIAFASNGARG
jgi:biopolymer transport protein ExbD